MLTGLVLWLTTAYTMPTILPTDCRNQTAKGMPGQDDGNLVVMSWHIHYNTVSSDQERFYEGFICSSGNTSLPAPSRATRRISVPSGQTLEATSSSTSVVLKGHIKNTRWGSKMQMGSGGRLGMGHSGLSSSQRRTLTRPGPGQGKTKGCWMCSNIPTPAACTMTIH